MKIVFVLSGSRLMDGSSKSFLTLLDAVLSNGHECLVVLPGNGSLYNYLRNRKVNVVYLNYRFNAKDITNSLKNDLINWIKWKRRQFLNYLAGYKLYKICKQFSPDIIHSNTSITNIGYYAARALDIYHITHFREYGDLDFSKDIKNLNRQLSFKKNYSISITRDIANYRKLLPERSSIIYNGIISEDNIRFNSIKDNYILYVGRIEETKGVRDLILAYVKYSASVDTIMNLYLVGDYNFPEGLALKNKMSEILSKNNLLSKVQWLGEVTNPHDYMYHALVTVIPSLNEGFGRVMPEAMANGSLIIGRNTGGTKEQLDNGIRITGEEIGFRFDNISELTSRLVEISSKPFDKYIPMIRRSQTVVRSLYSKKSYTGSILNIYDKILNIKNNEN